MLVELEGMILNSASKEVILESIKEFKEEHKNEFKTDEELLINFMQANDSFIQELDKSNIAARKRIKDGKELIDLIEDGSDAAMLNCTKVFAEIAAEIALITLVTAKTVTEGGSDPAELIARSIAASVKAAAMTAVFVTDHVPKRSNMTFFDLQEVDKYSRYRMMEYDKNLRENRELWKKANYIIRKLRLTDSY